MKILLKYTIIIAVTLLVTISCRDESKVRFPDFQSGVNARLVVHSDKLVLNLLDLGNASVVFDVYSANKDIDEITYTVTFNSAAFPTQKFPTVEIVKVPGSSFVNGVASGIELTAGQLAESLALPGGSGYLRGGDYFTFFASVKLKDGRVFTRANAASSIAAGANASFTTTFKLFVSCPFSADEAVGVYKVTADPGEWVAGAPDPSVYTNFNVVKGPGANQVTLKNVLGYSQEYDMIVDVDPITGIATVAKQKAWDPVYWGITTGPDGFVAGSGFFFSCSGFMSLNLAWTTTNASYGSYKIEITKN